VAAATTRPRSGAPDTVLAAAEPLAREVLVTIAEPGTVGEHLGMEPLEERLAMHWFACLSPGYQGWRWGVTVARVPRGKVATVSETNLLPGPDALLAPEWLPYADRLAPGDLSAGDVLPFRETDPYLATGDTPLREIEVRIPAREWVEVDDRMLPSGRHPVTGSTYDFLERQPVGDRDLDTAFTSVLRDADGPWRCTVASTDRTVTLWADESFGWLQVFTAIARDHKGVPGVAVEPMSCPADAFNSTESLVVLDPGQEWTGTWGITPE
jgi:hypothetical protein